MDHDFDYSILDAVSHRPWPKPDGPWVMSQTWRDLLFAHWPLDPSQLKSRMPAGVELDLFEGRAWLGIVPFRMTNVAPRGVPPLPGAGEFPELNVRTYVLANGRPGVFFFSLDAASALAVRAARLLLNLPYHSASMRVLRRGALVDYNSRRSGPPGAAEFVGVYEPSDESFEPVPGSLEYFLTERYCLYHYDRRQRPYRMEIHHPAWRLRPARLRLARNTMASVNGLALPAVEPLLHFSDRQDAVAWLPSAID